MICSSYQPTNGAILTAIDGGRIDPPQFAITRLAREPQRSRRDRGVRATSSIATTPAAGIAGTPMRSDARSPARIDFSQARRRETVRHWRQGVSLWVAARRTSPAD
jgi:hypothetical protein